MKDSTMSMSESQEEESSPSQNMQMELHSKGAVLTKAWSDLFSFITKYQAELTVKENTVEIAEREIDVRKRQLEEMKPMVDAENEEVTKLQEEIRTKERLLSKSQSELSVKGQMLRSVQSDLTCNMELLEKARCDLLDRQSELVRNRGDLERLKSELTIKQEQIQIKDNLLRKLQNQLMKENAELKEQLELNERTLEMERRSHEMTKRTLREKSKPTASAVQSVIEIPDSPPTLDLSVEQEDYGLSDIISAAEAQRKRPYTMDQDLPTKRFHSSTQDSALSRLSAMTSESFTDFSRSSQPVTSVTTPTKLQWSMPSPTATSPRQVSQSRTPTQMPSSPSFQEPSAQSDSFNVAATSASDTFFPLSVSQTEEDSKAGIDTSAGAMYTDTEMQGSGQYMPGTPGSSGTSDSNQGPPVPISGPIQSTGISPGGGMSPGGSTQEGADGKYGAQLRNCLQCENCGNLSAIPPNMGLFMMSQPGELKCESCGQPFCLKKFYGPPKKRTRVEITARQKQEICQFRMENASLSQEEVRQHFISNWGIALGRSTVHDIIKNSHRWLSIRPETVSMDKSRLRTCQVPELEAVLSTWIHDVHAHGFQPDGGMIIEKAKRLGKELGVENLSYSHGWLYRFKKRHGILKSKKQVNKSGADTKFGIPTGIGTSVALAHTAMLDTSVLREPGILGTNQDQGDTHIDVGHVAQAIPSGSASNLGISRENDANSGVHVPEDAQGRDFGGDEDTGERREGSQVGEKTQEDSQPSDLEVSASCSVHIE
ncbi:uncharacterized protein LOC135487868 isoform X1 [Lineus longissimus]|uniref:uncharacterized protein LOC135487868 isoform X1 n=1 Tax=Lineus longissimus TaxID=88925 RepID=UPI00315DE3EF